VHAADIRRLAADERADLAAFLATLTAQQWEAPTLCARWRVRDVVAHVISYDNLGIRALIAVAARARFRPGRVNDVALTRYDRHTPEQLLELLNGNPQPSGQPAALGGRAGLVETLIHHQDIRRALRQPRAVPAERLRPALHTAVIAPDIARPWPLRGVRLVATDLPFSAGIGLLAEGPAEAILMTVAGRASAISDLTGPGQVRLAARIGRSAGPAQR
jgi:uncharacterized protein (TIGR03083 family)